MPEGSLEFARMDMLKQLKFTSSLQAIGKKRIVDISFQ